MNEKIADKFLKSKNSQSNSIVESFDQFLQQASISQSGDPTIFGKNPKISKLSKRQKRQIKPKTRNS